MEVVHTKTKLKEELISILIETFENHGWTIEGLPNIFDSDEKKVIIQLDQQDFWDYDNFMGIYRQVNNSWCNEGEVVLFTETIQKVAQAFFEKDNAPLRNPETGELIRRENGELTRKSDLMPFMIQGQNFDFGITLKDSIDYLTAIVLIHELTHWLIHWGKDFNQESLRCHFRYEDGDIKEFHEGLAQYFTDHVLMAHGNSKLYDIFNFLKDRQSKPYQVFEELKIDLDKQPIELGCLFSALGICWSEKFNQSFDQLKKYNYLSVLYYPNNYKLTFEEIKATKPAIDQEKIIRWWNIEPFNSPNIFLSDYFDEENKENKIDEIHKRKTKLTSIKFGL
jgi:hypothetical protein